MIYRILIVAVVAAHFLFVATGVLGALVVIRWPKLAIVHIPVFLWAGFILVLPWSCPLTVLENDLRAQAGMETYGAGFVEHYIHPAIHAVGASAIIPYMGYMVLALNVAIYAAIFLRRRTANAAPAGMDQSNALESET